MVESGNKQIESRSEKYLIDKEPKDSCDSKNLRGERKVYRRTITIDDANEQNLNQLRGQLLTERNKEIDFTSAVNMVLSLGFHRLRGRLTDEEREILNTYLFGYALKIPALGDDHWTYWIEHEYPQMVKRLQRLEKKQSHSNSAKGKKKEDVPEPEHTPT